MDKDIKAKFMVKQRLIRILVYEGTPEWLQSTHKNRGVKGSITLPNGCTIREAIVGDFLEEVIENKNPLPSEEESDW